MEYITVKELAELQGVSVQSIYQRFNTTLKPYIKVIKGKKCIDIKALEEVYHLDIKDFKQDIKQDFKEIKQGFKEIKQGFKDDTSTDTIKLLQDTLDTLKQQLEQKDKQIAEKDKHIEELTKSLQFEQGKSKNLEDRVLLLEDQGAAEPSQEPTQAEPKKSWFSRLFS